jgi:hypothetical protein
MIYWLYPPGTAATHNGSLATEVGDSACGSISPNVAYFNGNGEHDWTHYASDPLWTACATHLKYSITVQFSDSSFVNSGPYIPQNKLSAGSTCPGWRTTA